MSRSLSGHLTKARPGMVELELRKRVSLSLWCWSWKIYNLRTFSSYPGAMWGSWSAVTEKEEKKLLLREAELRCVCVRQRSNSLPLPGWLQSFLRLGPHSSLAKVLGEKVLQFWALFPQLANKAPVTCVHVAVGVFFCHVHPTLLESPGKLSSGDESRSPAQGSLPEAPSGDDRSWEWKRAGWECFRRTVCWLSRDLHVPLQRAR